MWWWEGDTSRRALQSSDPKQSLPSCRSWQWPPCHPGLAETLSTGSSRGSHGVRQSSSVHTATVPLPCRAPPEKLPPSAKPGRGRGGGGRGLLCRLMTHRFLGIPSTCEEGAKSQHSDGKGSFAQSLVARVGGVSCGVGGVWRLCMRGETLRQKRGHGWPCGAASRKKACGQNFHRLLRHTGCACFPKVFSHQPLCHRKQSDSGSGVSEVQWASSLAAIQKTPTAAHQVQDTTGEMAEVRFSKQDTATQPTDAVNRLLEAADCKLVMTHQAESRAMRAPEAAAWGWL